MTFTSKDWMKAIVEGQFATADYIASYLPPVEMKAPEGNRKQFKIVGEIADEGDDR